jgi:LmbE family N-acetylglucosaminyl deacetylase
MPATILSPHLDDAVLSCWSVLSRPSPVTVVNVFAGLPPEDAPLTWWDRMTGAQTPRQRMQERIDEDAVALALANREPINLHFLEAQHRGRPQDVKPVVRAITPHLDRGGVVYAPAGIGDNVDHVLLRAAAVALRRRDFEVSLYADLPYCHAYGWPHWVRGADPDPYLDPSVDWRQYLDQADVVVAPESGVIESLSPQQREAKLAAVRAYRTQFSGLERGSARVLTGGDALSYEVFWPLGSARLTPGQRLRHELLWHAGVRRGSPLGRLLGHRITRRLRGTALERRLRHRARP